MLLGFLDPEQNERIERLLRIKGNDLTLINIDSSSLEIYYRSALEVFEGLNDGSIYIIDKDPFISGLQEDDIPKKWRQARERAWSLIKPLVTDESIDIFEPNIRGSLIRDICERSGCMKKDIYRYLRRWFQGGQIKNALLPRLDRCGAPGVDKKDNGVKRGRHRKSDEDESVIKGTNVDEDMKDKILIGAKLFHEKQKKTLKAAWRLTLQKYFMEVVDIDGNLEFKLKEKYPTFSQFRYWYKKQRDFEEALKNRDGDRKVNLLFRPLLGRSTDISFGPGSVFQIDATIADIYLVSVFDRMKIIGRPVITVCVDVWSYMITGFDVGLENMSKNSTRLALQNTFSDKVPFCRKYGIEISPEDWPCHQKPELLLADRAELIGNYGDDLINNLGINISNTAPYRADGKGLVEYMHHLLNMTTVHDIPGATLKPHSRGDRDPRLDATINIYEFVQMLISTVLYLNSRQLKNYPFNSDLIGQHVDIRPINLWNWGIKHRSGHLGFVDESKLPLDLLPRAKATVRGNGIIFKKHSYIAPCVHPMLTKARKDGSWRVDIAYNPHLPEQIHLISPDKKTTQLLTITDSDELFKQATFYDVDDFNEKTALSEAKDVPDDLEKRATLYSNNETIKRKAQREKKEQEKLLGNLPKSRQTANINSNRNAEKEILRSQQNKNYNSGEWVNKASTSEEDSYVPSINELSQWDIPSPKGDSNE